jgi:hypothetical protein
LVHRRHVREGMRFDHAECNNHYARPLCIWGAYASRLGLNIDGFRDHLSILPPSRANYDGLLLTGTATGRLTLKREKSKTTAMIEIGDGRQTIKTLMLPAGSGAKRATVKLGGKKLDASAELADGAVTVTLGRKQTLSQGKTLEVVVS